MKKWSTHWPYLASLICFVYVICRAYAIPLTYDEIWTIESLFDRTASDIFTYKELGSNSHLLNSLCIWFFHQNEAQLQWSEPLLYRLPNVLAFLLYAWFTIRLMRSLPAGRLQVMAFVLCFCNPFLLEFFSLARGYGLALAFTSASLYYLNQFRLQSSSTPTLTLIWASFAVLANFTWLNFYLVLLPVLVYLGWTKTSRVYISRSFWAGLALPSLILVAIILKPIIKLRQGDELWYGGQTGLVYDTFTSLFLGVMGFETVDRIAHLVLLAIFFLLVLFPVIYLRQRKEVMPFLQSAAFMFMLLFVLLSLSSILQNILFKTPFLVERTALVFLLPLLWLLLTSCELTRDKKYGTVASSGLAILSLATVFNFMYRANFTHSYSWPFDARSEAVMDYLNKQGEQTKDTIHLNFSWIMNVSLKHAAQTNNFPWVHLMEGDAGHAKMDYYYMYTNNREYAGYNGYNAYSALPDSIFRDTALYFPRQDLILLKVQK